MEAKKLIQSHLNAANRNVQDAIRHAWECGKHLRKLKAQIEHGNWYAMLSRLDLGRETARRMMRLSEMEIREALAFGSIKKSLSTTRIPEPEEKGSDMLLSIEGEIRASMKSLPSCSKLRGNGKRHEDEKKPVPHERGRAFGEILKF